MSETRKDKRAPVSLKVRFKSATLDEFIEQYSKDISRGGIFIKTKKPMAIGTLLKFEFQLQDQSRLIHGVGRVVWVQEPETATEASPSGMGIKFVKMDPESRTFVERVVDQRGDVAGAFDAHAQSSEPPNTAAESFFPSDAPTAELPPPEDRTVVRHASEFLESALADADETAAAEARAEAEAARERAREIERRRLQKQSNEALAREAIGAADTLLASPLTGQSSTDGPVDSAAMTVPARKSFVDDEEWSKPAETVAERPTARASTPEAGVARLRTDDPEVVSTRPVKKKSAAVPIAIAAVVLLGGGVFAATRSPETPVEPVATVTPAASAAPAPTDEVQEPEKAADEAEAIALATGEEPKAEEEPTPATTEVAVTTDPPGADVFVGTELKGQSPLTLSLPVGQEVVLRAKAAGRAEATTTFVVEENGKPLTLSLAELEYFVEIDSAPTAVRVQSGGSSLTTPGRLRVRKPTDPVSVIANKTGYDQRIERVPLSSFKEEGGAMVARLTLAMKPLASAPTAARKAAEKPAPAAPSASDEGEKAASEPKTVEPKEKEEPVAPTPPTPPAAPVVPTPDAP